MNRLLVITLCCIFVSACNPEKFEVEISQSDIAAVIEANSVKVDFEFETKTYETKKLQLDAIIAVIQKYYPEVEIDVIDDTVEIEGQLQLAEWGESDDPFYVALYKDNQTPADFFNVGILTGQNFEEFNKELREVNFFAAINKPVAVSYKINGNGMEVMTAGSFVDNEAVPIYQDKLETGKRIRFRFEGGIWEQLWGSFYVKQSTITPN